MSWRVLTTASSDPDFQALTEKDRLAVVDDLFGWLVDGSQLLGSLWHSPVASEDGQADGPAVSLQVDVPGSHRLAR